jgi:hypothetical protein
LPLRGWGDPQVGVVKSASPQVIGKCVDASGYPCRTRKSKADSSHVLDSPTRLRTARNDKKGKCLARLKACPDTKHEGWGFPRSTEVFCRRFAACAFVVCLLRADARSFILLPLRGWGDPQVSVVKSASPQVIGKCVDASGYPCRTRKSKVGSSRVPSASSGQVLASLRSPAKARNDKKGKCSARLKACLDTKHDGWGFPRSTEAFCRRIAACAFVVCLLRAYARSFILLPLRGCSRSRPMRWT